MNQQKLVEQMLRQTRAALKAGRPDLRELFIDAAIRLAKLLDAPRA
jgi:hypothetical protein